MDREPQPHTFRNVQLLKSETLGTGSYGVVCKAMCDQRLCATKLLHPIFFQSNDPGMVVTRTRFEQECRFLSEMRHPHIIEYLGTTHDPDSGLLVLLMELMDESLTHFLERSQQPLAYHIEVDLCHDIAQALAYIHSNGIIHRDLSSNNVLLLAGKAKITDFGMSTLLDANPRMTPLTMCPGTLVYMPPEATEDQPVYSSKIDCFSFGVLEIQVMTRHFPDPGPAMRMVQDSRYPTGRLKLVIPDNERRKSHIDLTHALLPTALSCLSYSEDDRPSAQDLCQQLATFKETPRYTQSVEILELQQQLQTKDQQLQDSQRCMHTLQQELQDSQRQLQDSQRQLQDSQRQIQQLTHRVEETQHTIEDREQRLRQQHQQLEASEQITAQFQQNLLQHEQTIRELQQTINRLWQEQSQAVEEKQPATEATEGPLEEPNEQQLQPIKPAAALEPEQNLMQQETMPNPSWKQSKVPETMWRGSVAVDTNMVYCNGYGSTTVHTYDLQKEEWGRVTDCSYKNSCLVIVQGMLTTVGGGPYGRPTNSLLSLTGEGGDSKWSPLFPAMPTKRGDTAAVYDGCSLIVVGGSDGYKELATVEVLDTNTRQWSTASSLLHPYSQATLGICGNRLYMLGGFDQHGRTRSVLTSSVPKLLQSCPTQSLAGKLRTLTLKKKQVWRQVTDAPHYRSTCSVLCGRLVAVGGRDEAGKETTAISAYNEKTDSWETMADMPTAHSLALVAIVSGKMLVIGGVVGRTTLDTVEIGTVL